MEALAHPSITSARVFPQIRSRHGAPILHHPHGSYQHQSHLTRFHHDSTPLSSSQTPPPSSTSPSSNRVSPAVLFIVVIVAVIFFISGLLHVLLRFVVKKRPSSSSPHSNSHQTDMDAAGPDDAIQRQLQQLFHLHDSGLDQAFIDSLPVFSYREILGPKEPFDCSVCLCEFSPEDRLRLLPACGHAFHLSCIDTWLLSNSTCPLCRGALFVPGLAIENPIFDLDDQRDPEDGSPSPFRKPGEDLEEIIVEKRVFPVRLGKFRSSGNRHGGGGDEDGGDGADICNEQREGESSSSNLDARRCFSMGSYQYILADANLQVELDSRRVLDEGGEEGQRIGVVSRGESFSVSKIWLWSNNKGKLPIHSDAQPPVWMRRGNTGDT